MRAVDELWMGCGHHQGVCSVLRGRGHRIVPSSASIERGEGGGWLIKDVVVVVAGARGQRGRGRGIRRRVRSWHLQKRRAACRGTVCHTRKATGVKDAFMIEAGLPDHEYAYQVP